MAFQYLTSIQTLVLMPWWQGNWIIMVGIAEERMIITIILHLFTSMGQHRPIYQLLMHLMALLYMGHMNPMAHQWQL